MKIKPGQCWQDKHSRFGGPEDIYVVCSQEPDDPAWKCMCFQDGDMGAYERELNEPELNSLVFVGNVNRQTRLNMIGAMRGPK